MALSLSLLLVAAVGQPVPVTAALLADLPAHNITFTAHGKTQSCVGPLLVDVAKRMGAPGGADVRGDALRLVLMASARDGYRVAFSLGELDPLLGNKQAIVATRCDGAALGTEDGPFRLVMANEKRGARSVRQLETLTLVEVK